jgi:hypothetical protein
MALLRQRFFLLFRCAIGWQILWVPGFMYSFLAAIMPLRGDVP